MLGQVRQLIVAALALLAAPACKDDRAALPDDRGPKGGRGAPEGAALAPMPAGAVRTTGKHFHLDTAPAAPCTAGICTVLAELTALDGYKVNDEYPFRFTLAPAPGISLVGEPAFRITARTTGRLTVAFRRDAAPTPFAGTLKLSVCNPDECLVETAALAVDVP